MAYHQQSLESYREAICRGEKFVSRTCPYCNGERDATVKHVHPSTKPSTPQVFWQHVLIDKYKRLQPREAQRNLDLRATPSDATKEAANNTSDGASPYTSCMTVVGPMVDQSELPFRLLCREFGATLAYTPMLHAKSFAESAHYRRHYLSTTPLQDVVEQQHRQQPSGLEVGDDCGTEMVVDRPCIVQFCGHDADLILAAAHRAVRGEDLAAAPQDADHPGYLDDNGERYYYCDAVDLNLGCPQGIARRGHYGSFLMEDWELIHTIIHALHVELEVPVTAKIRVFDRTSSSSSSSSSPSADVEYDEALTIAYARMIVDAGAQLLCIHGRTREMKGQQTGLANMDLIARVRDALNGAVPVIANGNVQAYEDVREHLHTTRCEGHMCAEPLLWDPALFSNPTHPVRCGRSHGANRATRRAAIATAQRYLHYVLKYPVDLGFVKAHLFKMLHHSYELHPQYRDFMCKLRTSGSSPLNHEVEGDGDANTTSPTHEEASQDEVHPTEVLSFPEAMERMRRHLDQLDAEEYACDVDGEQPKTAKMEKAATRAAVIDLFDGDEDGLFQCME